MDHLTLRATLRIFESEHSSLNEGIMTDKVTAYVDAMKNVVRSIKNKKATTVVILSPRPVKSTFPGP